MVGGPCSTGRTSDKCPTKIGKCIWVTVLPSESLIKEENGENETGTPKLISIINQTI